MDPTGSESPARETSPAENAAGTHRRAWPQRHPLALGLLVGLVGTGIVGLVLLVAQAMRDRPTVLTRADYERASARWDAHAPDSYDLDLELGGRRPGKVHVEVRDGEITHMTRDGIEPKQQRTWYYWSVPGQLDTIEQELDMAEDPAVSYGAPSASEVVLWAEFDPKYGYPRRFDRIVKGADLEVHWKVTRFEPVSPQPSAKNDPPGSIDDGG